MAEKVTRIRRPANPLFSTKARVESVDSPLGGKIYVRKMTVGERNKAASLSKEQDGGFSIVNYLLVRCVCDAKGERIYDDDQIEEMDKIDADVADVVVQRIMEFNGVTEKAVDDAKKN